MGTSFSNPFFPTISVEQNPKATATTTTVVTAAMSSPTSANPTTPEPQPSIETPKPPETQNPNPNEEFTDQSVTTDENGNPEEEEEGECGFCLFMKGGECRETFINWEKCVEEGEKNGEDIVDKCFDATSALKKCMEAHPDYYGVILQAEKDAEQEVNNQLDQLKEQGADDSNSLGQKPVQKQEQGE